MFNSKAKILLTFVVLALTVLVFAQEKLVYAVSYIRHADRTPYDIVDAINHKWQEGEGSLTALGMHQQYELGKQMRQRYINDFQLLSSEYQKGKLMVYSTSYDRTTMSAESFLYGFYPLKTGPKLDDGNFALPEGFQPIPIRTMSANDNNLINPEISDPAGSDIVVGKYSFSSQEWLDLNNAHSEDFKEWSKILGVKIDNLRSLLVPADNINCLLKHGYSLPEGLTKAEAEKMTALALKACSLRFKPKEVAAFYASPFLTEVSDSLQKAAKGDSKAQYTIYFGHDDPLDGIMTALNNPPDQNVPYAAHLDIELYKNSDVYTVKLFFNYKPVYLTDDKTKDSYSLSEFLDLLKPYHKK